MAEPGSCWVLRPRFTEGLAAEAHSCAVQALKLRNQLAKALLEWPTLCQKPSGPRLCS